MALVYAGGTYVSATFTGDTIANIITALQSNLTTAGWTVISGGGTANVLMQSATQSGVTNPIRVRIKTNAGTCACITLENQAGTLTSTSSTSAGGFLLPAASQTMRVIATKYWFCCFVPGSATAKTFVYAGMPYVDSSFLTGVTDIGMMFSNGQTEALTTLVSSFRDRPILTQSSVAANWAVIYNSSLVQNNNNGNGSSSQTAGAPECLLTCQPATGQTATARNYRWANDDLLTSDVLVGWGLTATTDEAKIRGQFYDMIYVADAIAADTSSAITATGHTFFNLTNNYTQTTAGPRGGMWVRTDT